MDESPRPDDLDDFPRLELLEKRLAVLEAELRALRHDLAVARGTRSPSGEAGPDREQEGPMPRAPESGSLPPQAMPRRAAGRGPQSVASPKPTRDLETWLGQNALLVVGVAAMILASAFLIKYAFDRGWISPSLRVLAGVIGGVAVSSYGELLHRKRMQHFGGALVGGGASITYLALWAGAGPYGLIPSEFGMLALLLVSGMVVASAVHAGTEYLAALACSGGLMAPIVLGVEGASPEVLVLYTGIVSGSAAAVALPRGWKTTVLIALAGYFLIPMALAGTANRGVLLLYDVLGGAAALLITRSRGWRGLEAAAFGLAWWSVALVASDVGGMAGWLVYLSLPILVAPSFLAYAQRSEPREAVGSLENAVRDPPTVYFVLSAVLWAAITLIARPGSPEAFYPLALLSAIALPYLALGLRRGLPVSHVVAFAVAAWAVWTQLDDLDVRRGWGILALASAVTTRSGTLRANRWIGGALAAAAAYDLLVVDYYRVIDAGSSAFVGGWALTLYFLIAVFVALAGPLWGEESTDAEAYSRLPLRGIVWSLGGLAVLAGGTELILLYFGRPGTSDPRLTADLTVSGYWLAYAGALLAFGFLRDRREVRIAGLAMTGLSILKVAFYDLTQLEALYRVASFFLLALIALGAAYAYHRRRDLA